LTLASDTPSERDRAFSTRPEHEAQLIPVTGIVTFSYPIFSAKVALLSANER
jgi:hypothetical protein